MAGVTLGFLKYILGFDTLSFEKGISKADADLKKLQRSFAQTGAKMAGLGAKLSVGITAPLIGLAGAGLKEAQETQAAMAQVNAALASMGPVAQRTGDQLAAAADKFEKNSLFEADEVLRDVTANMLTFGNISGQAFDRAQQAAIDLATRLQIGPKEAAIQVGKALNDPIKGITALGRAGIQFSNDQKAMIKSLVETGQTAKAQSIILGELERQFGGAAAAAQAADPINAATDAYKQLAETVGNALLPILPAISQAIQTIASAFTSLSPEMQKTILIVAGVGAAIGPLLVGLGGLLTVVAKIGPAVAALSAAWGVLKTVFIAARVAALATLPALTPFLVPLGLIAAAVGAVYLAWKNWDKIVAVVRNVYVGVKTWLQDKLGAVFAWVGEKLKQVGDWFFKLYDRVVGHSYVPDMVDGIAAEMARLQEAMVEPAKRATETAAQAFQALQAKVAGLMQQLFPDEARRNQLADDIGTFEQAAAKGIVSADTLREAVRRLNDQFEQATFGESLSDIKLQAPDIAGLDSTRDTIADMQTAIDGMLTKMPQLVDQSRQWRDVVGDVAQDIGAMVGDWLARAVEGTAKLKDLWKQLLGYAIRFLTSPNGLGSLIGGARADGGPVSGGKVYLVGERGPELFAPSGSGRIIPNHQLAVAGHGGGGRTVNMWVTTPDADSFRRSQRQIDRDLRRRVAR